MEKYRIYVKIEEIRELLREGKNEEALELTDGMDPGRIKGNFDCSVLAQVYLHNGMLSKAKECFEVMFERQKSRRVAMELVNLSIRLKQVEDAEKYFEEYRALAPTDYYNHIFRYKIDKLENKPLNELAASLEALKDAEFFDNWGYELAKVYHKMGEKEKCVAVCDEVILWFGEGEPVERAKALKAYYNGEISLKEMSEKTVAEKPAVIPDEKDTVKVRTQSGNEEKNVKAADSAENMGDTRLAPGGWITKEAIAALENAAPAAEGKEEETAAEAQPETTDSTEGNKSGAAASQQNNAQHKSKKKTRAQKKAEKNRKRQEAVNAQNAASENKAGSSTVENEVQADAEEKAEEAAENPAVPVSEDEAFEADIVRAVEDALREETEKANMPAVSPSSVKPVPTSGETEPESEKAPEITEKTAPAEKSEKPAATSYVPEYRAEIAADGNDAAFMAAVDRELGFVADMPKTADKDNDGNMIEEALASQVDEIFAQDDIRREEKKSGSVHVPRVTGETPVAPGPDTAAFLERTGTSLEDYFGFFAYRRDICTQLVNALEKLLAGVGNNICYCIAGERGNGKKVIINGINTILLKSGKLSVSQVVSTEASKVNGINLTARASKLVGRSMVIDRAGSLTENAAADIVRAKTVFGGTASLVITDYLKNLKPLFDTNPEFAEVFEIRIILPSFKEEDLMLMAEYKAEKAELVFDGEAYELLGKKLKCISRATEEGALARAEKYIRKVIDNTEQRNAAAYIKQTMSGEEHISSNVILCSDFPDDI